MLSDLLQPSTALSFLAASVTIVVVITTLVSRLAEVAENASRIRRLSRELPKIAFNAGGMHWAVDLVKLVSDAAEDGVVDAKEIAEIQVAAKNAKKEAEELKLENQKLNEELQLVRNLTAGIQNSLLRLESERKRLRSDAWVNLTIGILFAVFGIYIALSGYFEHPDMSTTLGIDPNRILLSVFINVIAFFFFRMYLSNQNDIKQNNNEQSTLNLKLTSLYVANSQDNKDLLAFLTIEFSRSERNIILNSDQRRATDSTEPNRNEFVEIIKTIVGKKEP